MDGQVTPEFKAPHTPEHSGRLMLVTNYAGAGAAAGGRELLCKLNHDALKELYGDALLVQSLRPRRKHGWRTVVDAMRGHIDGLDEEVIASILRGISQHDVRKVFIDGSNLGTLARAVQRRLPRVEVIVFFHNVESRFFLGALRHMPSPRAAAVFLANYLAERRAVRYSHKRVCLSVRDSRLLNTVYGRGATHVSALCVREGMSPKGAAPQRKPGRFALFVGGAFYANVQGITWFAKEVAPRAAVETCVIGRGFESHRESLEAQPGMRVLGGVDSLEDWYAPALFVIAPIFDGSGMKTKVAEALMHGKKVIGTPEAFSGYEDVAAQAGWICRTSEEFVRAIGEASDSITQPFDPGLRSLYEQFYSYEAARSRLAACVGTLV